MRNTSDHNDIENRNKPLNHGNDNFDDEKRKNEYDQLEAEKQNTSKNQHNEAKYLAWLLKANNTDEIFSKFLKLDKDSIKYLNYIKNGGKPKDISNELAFLGNPEIIRHTQNEYKETFEKAKQWLDKNDIISEISNIINKGGDIENNIRDFRRGRVFKNLRILQKFEKGEFITYPNGIVFELCKGEIAGGDITDYYIRTHIEKDTKHYTEYVDSLLNMRELFKSKGINIKYCRRETWLANREFIEAYEKIRKEKKESEGKTYEKSNILKVLEQTEQAVIFEKAKEGVKKDKKDNEQEKKSITGPIKFIKEGSDLYNFATGEGKELFHETEMWLDLDKLSQFQ